MKINGNAGKFTETGKVKSEKKETPSNPQVGDDKIVMTTSWGSPIPTKFAIDRNNNKEVEQDEIVKTLADLSVKDREGDDKLKGKELEGVFFEYSKDNWLEGNKENIQPLMDMGQPFGESKLQVTELDLKTGQSNLTIDITLDLPQNHLFPELKNFPGV